MASRPVLHPWIIDGDTLDDRAEGVRYRLANIDAPELEGKCFRERARAHAAKDAATSLVRRAKQVSVRRTFRWDMYGRRAAFVLVDGQGLGELLVQRGLAVPWRGRRKRWCGPNGGLALIAASGGPSFACTTCRLWR
jgi:endonuclease YncB( thermonuclease family)